MMLLMVTELYAGMIDKNDMAPWEICGLCHNLDGISVMAKFPKLAGQKRRYLKRQFYAFKHQKRSNDGGQMNAITSEVDPKDIDKITRYFSTLPYPRPQLLENESKSKTDYAKGKLLFEKGRKGIEPCQSCHNKQHLFAPYIKAQHGEYLKKQLYDFKLGLRDGEGLTPMSSIAEHLTDKEMHELVVYLKSTHQL